MVLADFRSAFPEFSDSSAYPDAMLTFWSNFAEANVSQARWGTSYVTGVFLYAAHQLSLARANSNSAAVGGAPGGNPGIATSKTVGGVSVTYDSSNTSETDAGFWNLTTYGKQYIRLARMFGAGPRQIGYGQFGPPGTLL